MLSNDARCLVTTYFAWGVKSTLRIGGKGAENDWSVRGRAAIDELVAEGYVTAEVYNHYGRMQYVGTDKIVYNVKLSFDEMDLYGKWSATERVNE